MTEIFFSVLFFGGAGGSRFFSLHAFDLCVDGRSHEDEFLGFFFCGPVFLLFSFLLFLPVFTGAAGLLHQDRTRGRLSGVL
jgi:hypothetical protein